MTIFADDAERVVEINDPPATLETLQQSAERQSGVTQIITINGVQVQRLELQQRLDGRAECLVGVDREPLERPWRVVYHGMPALASIDLIDVSMIGPVDSVPNS